jgi:hypothetical protein
MTYLKKVLISKGLKQRKILYFQIFFSCVDFKNAKSAVEGVMEVFRDKMGSHTLYLPEIIITIEVREIGS